MKNLEDALGEEKQAAEEFINECFCESFPELEYKPIVEWAAENVELDPTAPEPGKYDVRKTPQMSEPFEMFQRDDVRHIITVGPNQGGRTKGMEVASYWSVVHRMGPMQWNSDCDPKADEFAEQRWFATADKIPAVVAKYPANKDQKRKNYVLLNTGHPVMIQGANDSNLQQQSILTQFNDEIFKWKPGMLSDAHTRCEISYAANHKIWDGSIPGNEGTEWHESWKNSSRAEWSFQCRKCEQFQPFLWLQVKWETTEKTKPGGDWKYPEVKKTVRYECNNPSCKEKYRDTRLERKAMNLSAKYIHADPEAEVKGYRFNVLSVNWPGLSWGKFVEEFLIARRHARAWYQVEKLKKFFTRRMAEFWEEDRFLANADRRTDSDYVMGFPNIWIPEKWEGEWGRLMGVDKQVDHYPLVIRSIQPGGNSRMIHTGKADTYEEFVELGKEFGVTPNRILVDCGYERGSVYAAALKYGFTCMRGTDRTEFLHYIETAPGKKVKLSRPYSEKKHGDPGGQSNQFARRGMIFARVRVATVYEWSNLTIKNMLSGLKQGRAEITWGVPGDAPQDYINEINSEVRYRKSTSKGRQEEWWSNCGRDGRGTKKPNHRWDCECMILVAMLMQGLISWEDYIAVKDLIEETAEEGEARPEPLHDTEDN